MTEIIAGVEIPDTTIATATTRHVRQNITDLLFDHSRRVFVFGMLQARRLGLDPDPEIVYVASLFHDYGLVPPGRTQRQRFELDGADSARQFLSDQGLSRDRADLVWTAIALHTTPEVPTRMAPEIAATTYGVETDVLGLRLDQLEADEIAAVTAAHPRPDFKKQILRAFHDGFAHRPESTFGTVNADVLAHFVPGHRHIDFVEVIQESAWSE